MAGIEGYPQSTEGEIDKEVIPKEAGKVDLKEQSDKIRSKALEALEADRSIDQPHPDWKGFDPKRDTHLFKSGSSAKKNLEEYLAKKKSGEDNYQSVVEGTTENVSSKVVEQITSKPNDKVLMELTSDNLRAMGAISNLLKNLGLTEGFYKQGGVYKTRNNNYGLDISRDGDKIIVEVAKITNKDAKESFNRNTKKNWNTPASHYKFEIDKTGSVNVEKDGEKEKSIGISEITDTIKREMPPEDNAADDYGYSQAA